MKHVTIPKMNPPEVHFIYGNIHTAICGEMLPRKTEFTTEKVNCKECIRLVEQCKTVKEYEYIKP